MYGIKIGQDYFVSDDQPPVPKGQAARYATAEQAEAEAAIIRQTWDLKPERGPTTKVTVVRFD